MSQSNTVRAKNGRKVTPPLITKKDIVSLRKRYTVFIVLNPSALVEGYYANEIQVAGPYVLDSTKGFATLTIANADRLFVLSPL